MHYSAEQHAQLDQAYESVCEELTATWVSLARDVTPLLTQERAQEHIGHGAARRLMIITRCVKNIFAIFPVRKTELLNEDERTDLEINLHAFLIHVHGLPDNMAWAYILERKVPMDPRDIGLFQKKTIKHFPIELQTYLNSISNWHQNYAKNYRDALAHRIPPYVPPAAWTPEHEQEFKDFHQRAEQAMREGNFELALELHEQKHDVGIIHPAFLHSFLDEKACGPMLLHPQVIVDTRTILEIIRTMRPHLALPKRQESG
jgi:hypothetical protein